MLDKYSESEVHVDVVEERPTSSIAFGLERIGLIAIKAPVLSVIILFALMVAAIFGIERIKIDDSLSQLFRSDSKDYKQYEAVTKRFPATEFDVLVVVEGRVDVIGAGRLASADYRGALEVVSREDLVNRIGETPSDREIEEQAAQLDTAVTELGG